jgi:hypothetical protein
MKTWIVLVLATFSLATSSLASSCPDFSGKFISKEIGLEIHQNACQTINIYDEGNQYIPRHPLTLDPAKLDGTPSRFEDVFDLCGVNEDAYISFQFEGAALKGTIFWPSSRGFSPSGGWEKLEINSAGDLLLTVAPSCAGSNPKPFPILLRRAK